MHPPFLPLSRRAVLKGSLLALAAGAVGPLTPVTRAFAQSVPTTVIGTSQAGEPLVVSHLGLGRPTRLFILGGQHGGPEANTIRLARLLLDQFIENPSDLPPNIGLDILPVANPDGANRGTRRFLSGVDPNRNWGGSDWQTDGYDSNARFERGLGGPEPFSEQETRALADWVLRVRPAFVINYHSAGGFLFGGRDGLAGELTDAYAEASGYAVPRPGPGGGGSPLSYRATGSMNPWLRENGINGLLIELTTPQGSEFDRNVAGLRALLARLAALPAPDSASQRAF